MSLPSSTVVVNSTSTSSVYFSRALSVRFQLATTVTIESVMPCVLFQACVFKTFQIDPIDPPSPILTRSRWHMDSIDTMACRMRPILAAALPFIHV